MDIIDLYNSQSNVKRPGIGGQIMIAELDWITVWGTIAATAGTVMGDALRITGDHTFATGKGWRIWQMEDEQAKLLVPIIGARSSLGLKPRLETFVQGLTPEQAEMFQLNKDYTVLINAFGCGSPNTVQIGDKCNPFRLVASEGWGSGTTGGTDPRGWKLAGEANYAFAFYEGAIEMYPEEA